MVGGASETGEGLIQARNTPQVVFVARWGKTTEDSVNDCAANYSLAGARIIGCVLVDIPNRFQRGVQS